jgi:hypothetical protein
MDIRQSSRLETASLKVPLAANSEDAGKYHLSLLQAIILSGG